MKVTYIFLIIFLLRFSYAKTINLNNVFKSIDHTKIHVIKDVISENPINTKIVEVLDKKNKTLGFYRDIITTTGCNSACLPIEATLFYDTNKKFKFIRSSKGLTKKDHESFSDSDYRELELILNLNPQSFKAVKHPKDMVDVLTGETTKQFQKDVVRKAAYTTLRLNLYNQDTLKKLKEL